MTRSSVGSRTSALAFLPGMFIILAMGCSHRHPEGRGRSRRPGRSETLHNGKTKGSATDGAIQSSSHSGPQTPRQNGAGAPGHVDTVRSLRKAVYRLTLMGKDVGRLVQEEQVLSDRVRTEEQAEISLNRGSSSIHMKIRSRTEERTDATPVAFSVLLDQGTVKIRSEGHYRDGKLVIKDQSGEREIPYDRKWLFPAASERKILAAGFAKGTKVEFFQFDPLMGMTGKKVKMEVLGDTQIQWNGKMVTCHKVRIAVGNLTPGTACVDDENLAYESTVSFGAVSLHLTLLSKTIRGRKKKNVPSKAARSRADTR